MTKLTSHKSNWLNELLVIEDVDGACHEYRISIDESKHRPEAGWVATTITFQRGPIGEVGVNGVSNEALLAIVEDRLAYFQTGPYSCLENAIALTKVQEAMMWLQLRTKERYERGVEGTSTV